MRGLTYHILDDKIMVQDAYFLRIQNILRLSDSILHVDVFNISNGAVDTIRTNVPASLRDPLSATRFCT